MRYVLNSTLVFVGLLVFPMVDLAGDESPPLTRAHAHNDYEHKRPLFDAIDHGFSSVEADIYLVDGKLLVGHTRRALRPERTLQALYLDPLKERIAANGGRVYRGGPSFTLFIDIKTDGEQVYGVLQTLLAKYGDMISKPSDKGPQRGPIDVVISGDRPIAKVAADKDRRVGIDGRLSDLDSNQPADLIPIISDNWRLHFRWNGKGPIPAAEHEKLLGYVKQAHAHGRKIRLWATPETPAIWQELYDADVDLINTDDLAGVEQFLRKATKTPSSQ